MKQPIYCYIHNFPFPSEKAHSVYIAKSCEAAAQLGHEAHAVVSRRKRSVPLNPSSYFGLTTPLKVHRTYTTGILPHPQLHSLATALFALEVCIRMLLVRPALVQTPDPEVILGLLLLKLFGLKTKIIYDVHVRQPQWIVRFAQYIDCIVADAPIYKSWFKKQSLKANLLYMPMGYDPAIYNHLPTKAHARRQLKLPANTFIVGYVGRFETMGIEKGIYQLIRVVKSIKGKQPVFVYLVGGPAELANKYKQYAASLGLTDKEFKLVAEISSKKVGLHIKACDIGWLVYPDNPRFRDGISPMKQLEYSAAKVPMIASNFPSITAAMPRELLTLVNPHNEASIVRQLKEMKQHYRIYKEKAQALERRIRQYTWKNRQQAILKQINSQ